MTQKILRLTSDNEKALKDALSYLQSIEGLKIEAFDTATNLLSKSEAESTLKNFFIVDADNFDEDDVEIIKNNTDKIITELSENISSEIESSLDPERICEDLGEIFRNYI